MNQNSNNVVTFSSRLRIFTGVSYKHKDPKKTGKCKVLVEVYHRYETFRRLQILVHHERHINRANNHYFELVDNPDTGEIYHRCDEPLSDHRNHGSAKN